MPRRFSGGVLRCGSPRRPWPHGVRRQRERGEVSRSIRRSPLRPASHSAWCSASRSVRPRGCFVQSPTCSVSPLPYRIIRRSSRRGGGLTIVPKHIDGAEPLHLLVDSTGLKIYGEGEWLDQKHGIRSHRRWRKLHLGMDADTHEIVAVELTPDDVGDVSEIPHLLDQIDADVASMTADGAYDGEAVYDAVAERHPGAAVIIPPRATAVASGATTTQRDQHIATIAKHGRMGWQRRSGYSRRSLVETAMFRYKTIIGRRLRARNLAQSADRGENRMQRAQPDDCAWHAGVRPDPMIRGPERGRCDRQIPSCTQRGPTGHVG